MIGSSVISIPWSTREAGIIPAIILNIIFSVICYYTSSIVVKTGIHDNDFSDTVVRYFGKKFGPCGRVLQIASNVLLNGGAMCIYFLIIKYLKYLFFSQNLFPILAFILNLFGLKVDMEKDVKPDFGKFSMIYSGIVLCCILFPLLILKKITFLIKINSFGIYFVSVLIFFILYTGVSSLINTNFDFQYLNNEDYALNKHLYLFGTDPFKLAGQLTLGYFSHSFVISILKNSRHQEHNFRNLKLGYMCVCLTYMILGILGYIGFSGKKFKGQLLDVNT